MPASGKSMGQRSVDACPATDWAASSLRVLVHAGIVPHLLLPPQVIREFHGYECRERQVVPEAEAEGDKWADGEG